VVVWFYLFFFFSGVTALIYETAFARQLHLIFGSTLSAVSVVVAVFLGGIALGAALLGPCADRYSPLRLYGLLEIGVGVCALLAVILVPVIRILYAHLSPYLQLSGGFRTVVQGIMSAIILLPATMLMGATLPTLSRGLTVSLEQRFSRISGLYGINTIGAVLGTVLCGFISLEYLGCFKTVMAAMTANFLIGFFALMLAARHKQNTPQESTTEKRTPQQKKPNLPKANIAKKDHLRNLLLIMAAVSGLAALGYEVVWFRILSFSVVTDTYAFALMLGIYLLGIGGGSMIAALRLRHRKGNAFTSTISWLELGILEICIAILVIAGFAALIWLNTQLPKPHISDPNFWSKTLRNISLQALILIMPVTLILGYIFPLLVALYTASIRKMGSHVGRVSAVNTLGSIIGSLSSAFILIPLIGIQKSLLLLTGLSVVVGITALIFGPMKRHTRLATLGVCVTAFIFSIIFFPIRPHFGFLQIPTHKNASLLFYKESADQTVMVTEDYGYRKIRRLLINQQQATSTDVVGQRKNHLMGHLPLWACPEAQKALVICFGSGGTFGALGLYDLERVDCIEICSAVIKAASFFKKWNGDVLSRRHVRLIIDDGRSYLLTTGEQYDIITLEPMHPGLMGVSSLYSMEFYQEARKRLRPGGVLCQWVPLYSMTGQDVRSLIATAINVFPNSSLWIVGSEGILLCAKDSLFIDWNWLEAQILDEKIQESLRNVYLDDPWTVLSGFLLGPEGLTKFTTKAPIIRDDHPFIEYTIPRHQNHFPWDEMLPLAENRESPMKLMKGMSLIERDSFAKKWERKKSSWIERDRGYAAFSRGDFAAARRHLETAYSHNFEDRYTAYFLKEIYWRYGLEFSRRGLGAEAIEVYRRACRLDTDDPRSHFYLAVALYNEGRIEESVAEILTAMRLKPDFTEAKSLLARIRSRRQK